jgi:hypothetical protein
VQPVQVAVALKVESRSQAIEPPTTIRIRLTAHVSPSLYCTFLRKESKVAEI